MIYRITGMLYPAEGWENSFLDCLGHLFFHKKEDAEKAKEEQFLRGGYGIDGWFKAPEPVITELEDDSPYIWGEVL